MPSYLPTPSLFPNLIKPQINCLANQAKDLELSSLSSFLMFQPTTSDYAVNFFGTILKIHPECI
jgi:hypothetical protein